MTAVLKGMETEGDPEGSGEMRARRTRLGKRKSRRPRTGTGPAQQSPHHTACLCPYSLARPQASPTS